MESAFIISLDFELNWGVFEKETAFNKPYYFHNTKKVIPRLLSLFEENDIHVTWATVGMLFLQNKEQWVEKKPNELPQYQNKRVSSYEWFSSNFNNAELEQLLFAPELVSQIINAKNQELGTHTYSHYYCLEPGQTPADFSRDLAVAAELASELGVKLKSLVFPRNQINSEYLKICWEQGVTSVRSNPASWHWKTGTNALLLKKVLRTGDAYGLLPINTCFDSTKIAVNDGMPVQIPASRFLRPYNQKYQLLNKMRLKHILNEMTAAAKSDKCYHLWWHPHNFGFSPAESYEELKIIVSHYKTLQNKFGMKSLSMNDIYNVITK